MLVSFNGEATLQSGSRTYGAILFQVPDQSIRHFLLVCVFDGHADMDLASGDQINDHSVTVERSENAGEESVRNALPVRMHVQDDHTLFDRNSRGKFFMALVDHL